VCGIAGIFNYGNSPSLVSPDIIKRMTDVIAHRGPDDDGQYLSDDGRVGFGFRRLAIIDLSPAGHQPMSNADKSIWILFNGEIYNHLDIRKDLEAKGYSYKSKSDTETILYAYQEYGLAFIEKLYGMFGIAIWDSRKEQLVLVRDRIGIKPVYYSFNNGAVFFGSEIKSILSHPAVPAAQMNEQGLSDYLTLMMTPPNETLFKNIFKLEAGHYAVIDKHGMMTKRQYWDVAHETESFPKERFSVEAFCTENIQRLLRDSIKLRMMSDVPFGVLLSGGIDSSVNVALMAELMTRPVETFSVGFKDLEKYNELGYARRVSQLFKTNHHEVMIDETDAMNFFPKMIWHLDEPNADPVCVPLYFVSKLARESGTIVVQVGEGSDEEFAGYTSYLRELRYKKYYYDLLPQVMKDFGYGFFKRTMPDSLLADYARRAAKNDAPFFGGAVNFTEEAKQHLFAKKFQNRFPSSGRIADEYVRYLKTLVPNADDLQKMVYVEFKNRLAELLLMRVDKMGMAVSIEARVPFLDHRLVEFAFRIPEQLKTKNGIPKYIMKKAAEGIIPNDIIYRKKQGFAAPVSEWLRKGKLSQMAEDRIFGSSLMSQDIFNDAAVRGLFEMHRSGKQNLSGQIWTLLCASSWYDLNIAKKSL
jgi:asparagine synthase (glutamine-hydrolysing)